MRQDFERNLRTIQGATLELGHSVEQALAHAVDTLLTRNLEQASDIIEAICTVVGPTRSNLEGEILALIATQQPVAGDLRTLVALLEILAELERMGNYAASIAQATIRLNSQPPLEPLHQIIAAMGVKVKTMLGEALLALARYDVALARSIPLADQSIDELYEQLYQELLGVIRLAPQAAPQTTHLSRVAHNLERTADRVVNICEWIIFAATGEMKELNTVAG